MNLKKNGNGRKSTAPFLDILEAALSPTDLSEINIDDLEDFELAAKQNCQCFGKCVKQENIDATIYHPAPLKLNTQPSGPTVPGLVGARPDESTQLSTCHLLWLMHT